MSESDRTGTDTTEVALAEALVRLNRIGTAINRLGTGDSVNVGETLQLIAESALEVVSGASAVIYAYDENSGYVDASTRVSVGESGSLPAADDPRPDGLGRLAVKRRQGVLSYKEPGTPIHYARAAAGARSAAVFPLMAADQVVGLLYVFLHQSRPFSQVELLMLHNTVNLAAITIDRSRQLASAQRDLARKEEELARLRRAGLLISARLRLEETLESILSMALEVTNARFGIFRLVDASRTVLETRAIAGERLGSPAVEPLSIGGNSVMGWVAKHRQPLRIRDLRCPPWNHVYYPLDHSLEMRSELAVPLVGANGRLEGVLNLESPVPDAFSEQDSHLLQSLATQAIIAIQQIRLLDALQEIAGRLLLQPCPEVLNRLVDLAGELLNAEGCQIWTRDGIDLVLRATRGSGPPAAGTRRRLLDSSNQPVPMESAAGLKAPGAGLGAAGEAERTPDSGTLFVPLTIGDDPSPVGVFYVDGLPGTGEKQHRDEWETKVLTILAHYAALALHSAARQEALRRAQEQRAVAETFAAMGDVAANLLHQLNNKVGIIPVRVEGIQDKCAPIVASSPYLAMNLSEIERSATQALQAVQESLTLLRPMHLIAVRIEECVYAALASAGLPSSIEVDISGLTSLPSVQATQQSLTMVVLNLLRNACEAMSGRGTIRIRGDEDQDFVELVISDSGPGIPPSLAERVFEFSFSGGSGGGLPTKAGNLGFGLWWVRTLMVRLGGTISVAQDASSGAIFHLRIPRAGSPHV